MAVEGAGCPLVWIKWNCSPWIPRSDSPLTTGRKVAGVEVAETIAGVEVAE